MIEIIEPGPLASVQTVSGRPGWRHAGVPVGGAADAWSARLANGLVGNAEDAALIEITLGGATIGVDAGATIAVTGGLEATVDGVVLGPSAVILRPGRVMRIASGRGARAYLAVAGGIRVDEVLGSAATDLRTGFGGHEGRALRAGDRLAIGDARGEPHRWIGRRNHADPIGLVAGPHGSARELEGEWLVAADADRTGVRLEGARSADGSEVPSMGLPLGAIQVPPDGRPIVMLVDRPVTGGYRVPACVIGADVGRIAQLRPGDRVTFASVSVEEAREAWRRSEAALRMLEPLELGGDEPGWAGAHG